MSFFDDPFIEDDYNLNLPFNDSEEFYNFDEVYSPGIPQNSEEKFKQRIQENDDFDEFNNIFYQKKQKIVKSSYETNNFFNPTQIPPVPPFQLCQNQNVTSVKIIQNSKFQKPVMLLPQKFFFNKYNIEKIFPKKLPQPLTKPKPLPQKIIFKEFNSKKELDLNNFNEIYKSISYKFIYKRESSDKSDLYKNISIKLYFYNEKILVYKAVIMEVLENNVHELVLKLNFKGKTSFLSKGKKFMFVVLLGDKTLFTSKDFLLYSRKKKKVYVYPEEKKRKLFVPKRKVFVPKRKTVINFQELFKPINLNEHKIKKQKKVKRVNIKDGKNMVIGHLNLPQEKILLISKLLETVGLKCNF